jgi:hypothetical protein
MGICRDIRGHCRTNLSQRSFDLVQTLDQLTAMEVASRPVQWLAAATSDIFESWHPDCRA